MPGRRRTAILISGRGSNMAALIAAAADPAYPAEIALVLSSRANAAGLETARAAGVATAAVDYAAGQAEAEAAIEAHLAEHGIELVCLAGFMRLLSPEFVERWRDRLINIHPSLLPAFPGLNTHRRALDAGVKLHGCTVHFVRPGDGQRPDHCAGGGAGACRTTRRTRSRARVLAAEHILYPKALALVAAGRVRVVDELCVFADTPSVERRPGVLDSRRPASDRPALRRLDPDPVVVERGPAIRRDRVGAGQRVDAVAVGKGGVRPDALGDEDAAPEPVEMPRIERDRRRGHCRAGPARRRRCRAPRHPQDGSSPPAGRPPSSATRASR